MIWSVVLIPLGVSNGGWKSAAAILFGLLMVRVNHYTYGVYGAQILNAFGGDAHSVWRELASCSIWLLVTSILLYCRRYVASLLIGLSAAVYIPFVIIGEGIELFGALPSTSDFFLVLALIWITAGGYRERRHSELNYANRARVMVAAVQSGMATRQARNSAFYRGDY